MRPFAMTMVVSGLSAASALADGADGGLAGPWRFPERKAVVEFQRGDAGWNGVITSSPRPKEAGFWLFQQLVEVRAGELKGTLSMPEDGSTHEAVVTVSGDRLRAVVGVWIFSKTLELERVK